MENTNLLFHGEYDVTLDDAGRIAVPRNIRIALDKEVVLTKGVEPCLWLYAPDKWEKRLNAIIAKAKPDTADGRKIRRRYVAHYLELDKQGRILIPPTLREHAGLLKDCVVLGQYDYAEIWDKERCKAHDCSEEEYQEISEKFVKMKKEKESSDAGNIAHPGSSG
jgi:MraZ protein